MAPFDVIIAAEHSRGTVKPRRHGWDPDIHFSFDPRDVKLIQRGLGILSDICWAAGAIAILPGLHGVPDVLTNKEAEILREREIHGNDTTRRDTRVRHHAHGSNPKEGVVDEAGRCHGHWTTSTSATPGSSRIPAVNPMLTCMALAHRIATGIAAS